MNLMKMVICMTPHPTCSDTYNINN